LLLAEVSSTQVDETSVVFVVQWSRSNVAVMKTMRFCPAVTLKLSDGVPVAPAPVAVAAPP
jgi:hypothetical protein